MQRKIEKEQTAFDITDPDLNMNATNYRYNHKYKDPIEIILHFIDAKILKYAYK